MQSTQSQLPQRKIGGENVAGIGLGLMGLAIHPYKDEDPAEIEKRHLEFLTAAADRGETFWDTSDLYGPFTNEELVGKWFKQTGRRKEIFLATKFGIILGANYQMSVRGDKEYLRQCIEASLKRLQTDYIDLYYQHRIDPNIRIEDTVAAMAELVKEGKVRQIGLSECSTKTLRRAHKVHPIAAVQIEYSLFSLDIEREEIGLKKACDELGVAIVAYSPLSRGLLTGQIKKRSDLTEGDYRFFMPRFSEENFDKNMELVSLVEKIAQRKGCTPGQLALAWLLRQGENVIPIPGTRQLKYLEENLGALKVELTAEEDKEIRELSEKADVKGERYPAQMATTLFADTIE